MKKSGLLTIIFFIISFYSTQADQELENLKREHERLKQEIITLKAKYFEIEKKRLASLARTIVYQKANESIQIITQTTKRVETNIQEIQRVLNNIPRFNVDTFPTNANLSTINIDEKIIDVKNLRKRVRNERFNYEALIPLIDTDIRIITDALAFFQTDENKIPIKYSENFESNELNDWFKENLISEYKTIVSETQSNNEIIRKFIGYVTSTVHDKYYNQIHEYEDHIDKTISYLRNLALLKIIQEEERKAQQLHVAYLDFVKIEDIHNVFIKLDLRWNNIWFLGKDYYAALDLMDNYRNVISVIERYVLPFSFDPETRRNVQIYLDSKLDEIKKREKEIKSHPPEYWLERRLKDAKKVAKNQTQKEELEKAEVYYLLAGLLDIPDYFYMAANQALSKVLN